MPSIRQILQEMGLHLSVQPPPFQDLVQHKKAEREIAARTLYSSGIVTTSAPGIMDRIPTSCRDEGPVPPNSPRAFTDTAPASWRPACRVCRCRSSISSRFRIRPSGCCYLFGSLLGHMVQNDTKQNCKKVRYLNAKSIKMRYLLTIKYDTFL